MWCFDPASALIGFGCALVASWSTIGVFVVGAKWFGTEMIRVLVNGPPKGK
jgi:hypothetical protein